MPTRPTLPCPALPYPAVPYRTLLRSGALLTLATALALGPAAGAAVPTHTLDAQPLPTQPLHTQPLGAQPLHTQLAADVPGSTRTWGLVPTPAEGEDQRVSFRFEAEPGTAAQDSVTVQNFSDEELTFALTPSDGVVTPEGVFDILPSDVEPEDVGTWIDIAEEVTVPAQGTADVPFTLAVPADALPGDHPGGITASVLTESTDAEGNRVALDARVGVRIHLRVAGDLVPQAEFQDVATSYATNWNPFAPGELTIDYTLANTGNVRVGATQGVEVAGPLGIPAGGSADAGAQQREILPRQASTQRVVVTAWPLVHLTSDLRSAQNVVGEDEVAAELTDASAQDGTWAVPWPQLILLLLLVALIVLWRRRRAGEKRRLEAAVEKARREGRAEAAGSTAAGGTAADAKPAGATAEGGDAPPTASSSAVGR